MFTSACACRHQALARTPSAATGTEMRATAIMPPREDFNLVFDRPFLLAITDQESGTILFLGIIGDPKE
jgi:serine protease inhibitor